MTIRHHLQVLPEYSVGAAELVLDALGIIPSCRTAVEWDVALMVELGRTKGSGPFHDQTYPSWQVRIGSHLSCLGRCYDRRRPILDSRLYRSASLDFCRRRRQHNRCRRHHHLPMECVTNRQHCPHHLATNIQRKRTRSCHLGRHQIHRHCTKAHVEQRYGAENKN